MAGGTHFQGLGLFFFGGGTRQRLGNVPCQDEFLHVESASRTYPYASKKLSLQYRSSTSNMVLSVLPGTVFIQTCDLRFRQ